ncbi:MAG: fused MFS/spermidine synthase [Planctomycetota bacterium]
MNALLLFASGSAGLIYQVLWMKQLGLLFGNTSHAAAATLSAFFLGLAAGGLLWGRRAARAKSPLRWYAALQAGIALTALLYFIVLRLYHVICPLVFRGAGVTPGAIAVKFCLALLLVFPPALFMGGTVPLMGQHVITDARRFGRAASFLYGINTLGSALGAYVAGFHLPIWLGYRGAYGVALGVTVSVAAAAWALSRSNGAPRDTSGPAPEDRAQAPSALSPRAVASLCLLSGFGVLGLEVLWTRMFAQVLQNSVYTFAAVLVTVLVSLAAGAGIANRLCQLKWRPARVLFVLLVAAGLATGATPFVFMHLTDNLRMIGGATGWGGYVVNVFKTAALVMAVPGCLLGTVFPYLLRTSQARVTSAGRTLGELSAINTVGAILGSLFAGFVLLDWVGLWPGIRIFSLLYILPALALPVSLKQVGPWLRAAAVAAFVLNVFCLNTSRLPRAMVNEQGDGEELVEVLEGSAGTVAVTRTHGALAIKLNSHYGLGSTAAILSEQVQADIPLMIRAKTRNVFFLGMGTGITAGAALAPRYSVERVVSCELVPEVVVAARRYFEPYVNGLFTDPRSTIVVDDGRHYLSVTRERFDLIDADLFVPCRSGAGSLYAVEHFRAVKRRLEPGGTFVQWLPLYQLTRDEFGIIARSMLEVFPQVTLWRNNFLPRKEVVALAAHRERSPLPAVAVDGRKDRSTAVAGKGVDDLPRFVFPFNRRTVLLFYCGNLSAARELLDGYPVNTDDRPLVEYLAPRSREREAAGRVSWFVGEELLPFLEAVQKACPPETDPVLANRSPPDRRLARAGLSLYKARLHSLAGTREEAERAWKDFVRDWLATDERGGSGSPP